MVDNYNTYLQINSYKKTKLFSNSFESSQTVIYKENNARNCNFVDFMTSAVKLERRILTEFVSRFKTKIFLTCNMTVSQVPLHRIMTSYRSHKFSWD